MLFEYMKSAYNNMFRYPNRFWAIIITVSLATFCLLGLTSVIQTAKNFNQHKIESLKAGNINSQQYIIQTANLDKGLKPTQTSELVNSLGAKAGYYFEDLTEFMWDYEYLIPWVNYNDQLILEAKPIMINSGNDNSSLKGKITSGTYFTGKPHEVIISEKLLSQFVDSSEVMDGNLIVIEDGKRSSLKKGNGDKIDPETIIGETVELVYNIGFEVDKESESYFITTPKSVPLKVVGIFDNDIGYQTAGNVWLPLSLKGKLDGMNSEGIMDNLSGKMAVQHTTPFLSPEDKTMVKKLGMSIQQFNEPGVLFENSLRSSQVKWWMFTVILTATIILGITCIVVISYLISTERRYEFQLLRALGASIKQVRRLFMIELFLISGIGTATGLLLSLFVANSITIGEWIGVRIILDGWTTILIVCLLPVLSVMIGFINLSLSVKQDVTYTLKLGE